MVAQRLVHWIVARAVHAYHVAILPIWGLSSVFCAGVLMGAYQLAVVTILPPEKRGPWDLYNVVPHWSWGWYALIGSAVIILLVLEGSYRHWRKENNRAEELERRLKPALKVSFDETDLGVLIRDGEPLKQIACAAVENCGGVHLRNCQALVHLTSPIEGFPYKGKFPLHACAPFDLRIGERKSVMLFSLDFDLPKSNVELRIFTEVGDRWEPYDDPLVIPPVDFDAEVQCISSDSQPSRCVFQFRREPDRWRIVGVETHAPH